MQNFDKARYLGTWYEAMRSRNNLFQRGEAVVANYSLMEDGDIRVRNSIQQWTDRDSGQPPITNHRRISDGRAIELNPGKREGLLGVKFNPLQPWWGRYQVLHTDYISYSLVYSNEYVWVLTREPLTQDSPNRAEIIEKARRKCAEKLPDFNFEAQMRDTLQGADLPNINYRGVEAARM